jgi:hypothetical protein
VTVEALDQCFPVPGCHHPLPELFALCYILHFSNVVDLERASCCLAIFTFVRVQSFDQFRSTERECQHIGRNVNLGIIGSCLFEVFGAEYSDDSRLFLLLYG